MTTHKIKYIYASKIINVTLLTTDPRLDALHRLIDLLVHCTTVICFNIVERVLKYAK